MVCLHEVVKPNNARLSILETRAAHAAELVNDCYVEEANHQALFWCQVVSCLMESLLTANQASKCNVIRKTIPKSGTSNGKLTDKK